MVGDAAGAAVHGRAAERFGVNGLAGGGEGQFGAAQVHETLTAHDHHLIAQRRNVRAAGGAGAHHHGDLRNAVAGHADLVVEDRTELAIVRKNVGLVGQERAAAVHQGDAGQAVLPGEGLRADVLLAGQPEVGSAFNGGVVGDDHARSSRHHPYAGDDAGAGRHALVAAIAGEFAEFQEGRAGVHQQFDAIPRQHLVACQVLGAHFFRPPGARFGTTGVQVGYACGIGGLIERERFAACRDTR